jgi:aspartate/tyrosine/aromatic aminotransferase
MFAYTGLNKQQCETLIADYKVYLTMNGRISIAGLNKSNVDYVAKAIHEVSLKK